MAYSVIFSGLWGRLVELMEYSDTNTQISSGSVSDMIIGLPIDLAAENRKRKCGCIVVVHVCRLPLNVANAYIRSPRKEVNKLLPGQSQVKILGKAKIFHVFLEVKGGEPKTTYVCTALCLPIQPLIVSAVHTGMMEIVAALIIWMKELHMQTSLNQNILSKQHAFEPTTYHTVSETQPPVSAKEEVLTNGASDQRVIPSYTKPIEDFSDDGDNWIHYNSEELNGYEGPHVPIGEDDNNGRWLGIQRHLLQMERQREHIINMLQVSYGDKKLEDGSIQEIESITASQDGCENFVKLTNKEEVEELDHSVVDPQLICSAKDSSTKGKFGPFGLLALASSNLTEQTAIFFRIYKSSDTLS
ncbi:cell wall invertase CWI1 [Artemisia annua]|uniref:Cell wall invertase CWI1 n=1 Tax=Artemisia annua TaxID=35608 RepID=A0A2U1PM72_ARTAN|nr:cell wall invertase CWI1 [Artemisia annua]